MRTTNDQNFEQCWDEVHRRVVESFDKDDPAVQYAIREWEKEIERSRDMCEIGLVKHRFTSAQVIEKVCEYCRAAIGEHIATYREKVARRAREHARAALNLALGRWDAVVVDDSDETQVVLPEYLGIVRVSSLVRRRLQRELVEASLKLARNTNLHFRDIHWPVVPGLDVDVYARELEAYLEVAGEGGRKRVLRIGEDVRFAHRVAQEEGIASVLRLLANAVVESAGSTGPSRKRTIGFVRSNRVTEEGSSRSSGGYRRAN